MKIIQSISFIVFATAVLAQVPQPAAAQSKPIVIHAGTLHIGNGSVLTNQYLGFQDGKITYLAAEKPNWSNAEWVEAGQHHVYPGLIVLDTTLGITEVDSIKATRDFQESGDVNPNIRAIIAYNTDSEIIPTQRFNGILTAQVTPRGGLVSGQSAIVQLDAWNWEDAAIKAEDGIHINWPAKKVRRFDFATVGRSWQENKQHDSNLQTLDQLFADAKSYPTFAKEKPNLKLAAMQGLLTGDKRLYIHADDAGSILEACERAQRWGVKHPVLVGAAQADQVADFLAKHQIPVIVQQVHNLPEREDSPVDSGYTLANRLIAKGVKVALSYPSPSSGRNLPFFAGTCAAYGLDKEKALQLITANPAEILGLEQRLGQLKVGLDATLFISEGDALDMRTNKLTHAFIQGRLLDLEGRQQKLYQRFHKKYAK
ncbi:MAG: amidohydrolase family protein [Acidobacteria bacterium]|nr:amidohydrolase family protein [Acidobacteriota bacterium]